MANKKDKKIRMTLEVEPPYTYVGIFTFLGPKDKGLAITSKPIELKDGTILHVGERGGIRLQTTKTGGAKSKQEERKKIDGGILERTIKSNQQCSAS